MTDFTIGVDISKDTLDVHRLPDSESRRFPNDAKGIRALIKWLAEGSIARVVFEATGAYHRTFEQALGRAGLPLCKINPRWAKRFGEAFGRLAKTDRIDAALLARLGVALEPPIRPAPSQIFIELKELHVARTALIKDRTAAKTREKTLASTLLRRQLQQRLKQIEAQLAEIEAALMALIASDPELTRRFTILTSIPGVAARSASALLIDMPELGALDSRTAAALSGTAPIVRQSGKRKGKASVQGGRAWVRQALYMPALVAARFNPDLRATYVALTARGKLPKVALAAVMRKLVILANALIRDNRIWSENPV